jgi:hypothetical protein
MCSLFRARRHSAHLLYNLALNNTAGTSALEVYLKPTAIATCIAMPPAGSGLQSTCLHARLSEENEFRIGNRIKFGTRQDVQHHIEPASRKEREQKYWIKQRRPKLSRSEVPPRAFREDDVRLRPSSFEDRKYQEEQWRMQRRSQSS